MLGESGKRIVDVRDRLPLRREGEGGASLIAELGKGIEADELVDLRLQIGGGRIKGEPFDGAGDQLYLGALDVRFRDGDQGFERAEDRIELRASQLLVLVVVVERRRVELDAVIERDSL